MSDRQPSPPPPVPPAEPVPPAAAGWSRSVRRGLVWGVLLAALVVVALIALRGRGRPTPPPPILGAALTESVPGFELTNRDGRTVDLGDLAGRPWVADLIFTRCVLACPRMSERMARLDRELPAETRLVSISIDPGYDTPERLAEYAAKRGASDRWLFLTGDEATIRALALNGLKLGVARDVEDPDPGTALTHSDRFVLLDGRARPRGYYDPFEKAPGGLTRLERELAALAD